MGQQKPQQSSEGEEFINSKKDSIDYTEKEMILEISDIFSLCKERCNPRFLSTMVYIILKHFKVSFHDADAFLSSIGAMIAKTCRKWTQTFLYDFDGFVNEGSGEKQKDSFYHVYPVGVSHYLLLITLLLVLLYYCITYYFIAFITYCWFFSI